MVRILGLRWLRWEPGIPLDPVWKYFTGSENLQTGIWGAEIVLVSVPVFL